MKVTMCKPFILGFLRNFNEAFTSVIDAFSADADNLVLYKRQLHVGASALGINDLELRIAPSANVNAAKLHSALSLFKDVAIMVNG